MDWSRVIYLFRYLFIYRFYFFLLLVVLLRQINVQLVQLKLSLKKASITYPLFIYLFFQSFIQSFIQSFFQSQSFQIRELDVNMCCVINFPQLLPLVITLVILIWESRQGVWDCIPTCPSSFSQIPETNPIIYAERGWKTLFNQTLLEEGMVSEWVSVLSARHPSQFSVFVLECRISQCSVTCQCTVISPQTGLLVSRGWDYILLITPCLGSVFWAHLPWIYVDNETRRGRDQLI